MRRSWVVRPPAPAACALGPRARRGRRAQRFDGACAGRREPGLPRSDDRGVAQCARRRALRVGQPVDRELRARGAAQSRVPYGFLANAAEGRADERRSVAGGLSTRRILIMGWLALGVLALFLLGTSGAAGKARGA